MNSHGVQGGGKWRALLAVALALVAVLAVNLFGRLVLDNWRIDVTEEKLFTITDATRRVLASLEEPVTLRLHASRALGEQAAPYAEHMARVRAMLNRYAALAPGRLRVEIIDPEPFSAQEDQAIAAGLRPVPLPDGRNAWFGIIGENTTGQREVLPFLPVERAPLLEYDLTLLVHRLSLPRKPVVGVLSSLPMFGKILPSGQRSPEWAIIAQLKSFYQVRRIDPAAPAKDLQRQLKDIDVLLLATPVAPPEETRDELWRAVEEYLLAGRPAVLAVDPLTEAAMSEMTLIGKGRLGKDNALVKMLRDWGIEASVGRFVADPAFARKVVFEDGGRQRQAPWLAWLELNGDAFAKGFEELFVNVREINVASAGALSLREGARLKAEPVIAASPRARLLDIALVAQPDPLKALQAFTAGKAEEQRPWLALRVRGEVGEKGSERSGERSGEREGRGKLNLLLIGDADFLTDRFWARLQDIGDGRKLVLPLAGNATFVLNALAQMSGGEVLAGLSGRMMKQRRFERIEELRRVAETQYRAREQQLRQQLMAAEKRLAGIGARVEGGRLVISPKDRQRIAEVRQEILQLRRSLRDVQQALVRDIRRLEFRLKALNIAGVALLVALAGLLAWGWQRWRARRLARQVAQGGQA